MNKMFCTLACVVLSSLWLPACAGDPAGGDAGSGGGGDDPSTSATSGGAGGAGSSTSATTGGQGGGAETDPFGPDPQATVTFDGGDIASCLPGFLTGGGAGAYAGFAGSSDGAYFIWKNAWSGSSLNLRIETWNEFGGITAPGTYEIQESDRSYDTCAVCVFSETSDEGEFWLMPGSKVTFTSLVTGDGGVGKELAGSLSGTMSNGTCTGTVEVTFHAVAEDISYGPL